MKKEPLSKHDTELQAVKAAINNAHSEVLQSFRTTLEHARECGIRLSQAQDWVEEDYGYGHWQKWLKENCPGISFTTASNYMRIPKIVINSGPILFRRPAPRQPA